MGKFLFKGLTLDELMKRVETYNVGLPEEELDLEKKNVLRLARGYQRAQETNEPLLTISQDAGIVDTTVHAWRQGAFPRKLKSYTQSLSRNVVEHLSLEQILANVQSNNFWEKEAVIQRILQKVEATYQAYNETMTMVARTPVEITRKYNREIGTVNRWRRNGVVPDELQRNLRSVLPTTEKERKQFAYLLGVFTYRDNSPEEVRDKFDRTIKDGKARQHCVTKLRGYLHRKIPTQKSKIVFTDYNFVQALRHTLYGDFFRYVATAAERRAYLKGVFDSFNPNFNGGYIFSISNQKKAEVFTRVLIEEGIYPTTLEGRLQKILIKGDSNVRRIESQRYDFLDKNKTPRLEYLENSKEERIDFIRYHTLRAEYRRNPKQQKKALTERFNVGSERKTRHWIADLSEIGKHTKPYLASRYHTLVEKFGLQDPHDTGNLVVRNRRIIIPYGGAFIFVEGEPVETLEAVYGKDVSEFTEEDLRPIQTELELVLEGHYNGNGNSDIGIDSTNTVSKLLRKYPYQNHLSINIKGTDYLILNKALHRYFTSFAIDISPIDEDEITQLQKELTNQEDPGYAGEMLLNFKLVGKVVIDIKSADCKLSADPYIKMIDGKNNEGDVLGHENNGHGSEW